MLNRVLAEAAFQAFTNFIDTHGIGEFRFTICDNGQSVGEVITYFF